MKHRSEYQEQVAVINWCRLNQNRWPELELVNGSLVGVNLNVAQRQRQKLCGVLKNWPDIFLPVARKGYHGLFIELKKRGATYPTLEQKKMLSRLSKEGYLAIWGRGSDWVIKQIEEYLKTGPVPKF